MTTGAPAGNPATSVRAGAGRRPAALSILLVVLSAGSAVGSWKGITGREEFFLLYPRLRPFWVAYLCIAPLNIVGAVAIWRWRKWGFWLTCVLAAAAMAIELFAMARAAHVWRVPVALALTSWLVSRDWSRFR